MNRVLYIVIVSLVAVIILMRACDDSVVSGADTIYTRRDTIWKETKDTVIKNVVSTRVKYVPFETITHTDIDTCNKDLSDLMKEYNRQTTYKDTIRLDSLGYISVIDTVFQNKLSKRTYIRDYKIPLVTETTTIIKAQQPKRQLYIGGNLFGDKRTLQAITPGLLYKDRKDRVFMANVGINFDGSITYGVGTYFKIKLK